MKIWRIRKEIGIKGYPYKVYHADVIIGNSRQALEKARKDKVYNWRWIDSYSIAISDYIGFEVIEQINIKDAKEPRKPWK